VDDATVRAKQQKQLVIGLVFLATVLTRRRRR